MKPMTAVVPFRVAHGDVSSWYEGLIQHRPDTANGKTENEAFKVKACLLSQIKQAGGGSSIR